MAKNREALEKMVGIAQTDADKALEILKANGEDAYVIGEIIAGDEKIIIE